MGKTLVTGATGFIGAQVARALAERGDEVRVLARRTSDLTPLGGVEVERVTGDVTDRASVRRAMKEVERTFHVAGRTSLRHSDRELVFDVNVRGSRIVFEEALRAGVERLVHTSSVGAIGVAKPKQTADETTPFEIGHLGIAYVNSKHEAELEALRACARGLAVVIVNPSFVLGPGGPGGTSMRLVRRFLRRQIPAYVDGGLNIVDVRDVAEGHLLADREGKVGERYILAGRNFTLDRLFADMARISGVEGPAVKLPARAALLGVRAASLARLPLPVAPDEVLSAGLWWTYSNAKARRELGFAPRSHEETLSEAIAWEAERAGGAEAGLSVGRIVSGLAGRMLRTGGRIVRA
ncbi:MAG TPA: SDR family oxidoreductase [Solirubrobacterales bacterium]|nr:SDR family oxidoreductase [Solirubrobacterales bacterium]